MSRPLGDTELHELLLARVRMRLAMRIEWLRHLWAQEGSPTMRGVITHEEADASLEDRDAPDRERAWHIERGLHDKTAHVDRALADALAISIDARLARAIERFGLNDVESDIVQACLALDLDPTLARSYAYANDVATRAYATQVFVGRIFGHGRSVALPHDSNLRRWQIVTETPTSVGEPAALVLESSFRDWLLGSDALDAELESCAIVRDARAPIDTWPVDRALAWFLRRELSPNEWRGRMRVIGPPGSGRRTFAATVSERLGMPLVAIDCDAISDERWPTAFLRAQRMAIARDCALAWYGDAAMRRRWPESIAWTPVQFAIAEDKQSLAPSALAIDLDVTMPALRTSDRTALWKTAVTTEAWTHEELETLVLQERATVGEIAFVARHEPGDASEALAHLRSLRRDALGELAQRLECPFRRGDLVVPARLRELLDDFTYEARERVRFWEDASVRRLFPQGRGLLALFSGPSGTGKTMAAQVLAAELGLDLFRLDLSTIVSKYVGETSKNLERILLRAAHLDVVLLFDEADALFGKRTDVKDAHDRFANTDTNHLLAGIESYPGIAILATNRKHDIDSAFTRRIRYALDFTDPDQDMRHRIWRQLVGELAGKETEVALDGQLRQISSVLKVTGAQIKYALLSALFAARRDDARLSGRHIARGLERELMKEGRPLDARAREVLV